MPPITGSYQSGSSFNRQKTPSFWERLAERLYPTQNPEVASPQMPGRSDVIMRRARPIDPTMADQMMTGTPSERYGAFSEMRRNALYRAERGLSGTGVPLEEDSDLYDSALIAAARRARLKTWGF